MKDRLYLPSENAQPLLPCLRHCPIVLTSQVQSNIPTVELSGRLSFELHDLGYEFRVAPYRMRKQWTVFYENALLKA